MKATKTLVLCGLISMSESLPVEVSQKTPSVTSFDSGRRSFVSQAAASAGLVTSSFFPNIDSGHGTDCTCDNCGTKLKSLWFSRFDKGHGADCTCDNCASTLQVSWFSGKETRHTDDCSCGDCAARRFDFLPSRNVGFVRPRPAFAYEDRKVGGDKASAETEAWNIQARQTNERLEKEGFKLDTRDEEAQKIKEAFSTFSYETSSQTKQQKSSTKNQKSK